MHVFLVAFLFSKTYKCNIGPNGGFPIINCPTRIIWSDCDV